MTAPIDKNIRKIVTEEAEAAARRLAREVGALAREVAALRAAIKKGRAIRGGRR